MMPNIDELTSCITEIANLIEQGKSPSVEHYRKFTEFPELSLHIVSLLEAIDEADLTSEENHYSSCIYALDVCVAQLQIALEGDNKFAEKTLEQLMSSLAVAINRGQHTLSFWLPILNAFYEVHVELSDELKDAYLTLANEEEPPLEEKDHLTSMQELLSELSHLSDFEIAENFFAQSYAMPAEFYAELVIDLYETEGGQDVALLMLLHPKQDVREVVIAILDVLMSQVTLTSRSLSRLQSIQAWYGNDYQAMFSRWIKIQRKKGVVFAATEKTSVVSIHASEIDGGGAQGIFIHTKQQRKHRVCGLLLKQQTGIKDVWVTPSMSLKETRQYYKEAFDDTIYLRSVDMAYVMMMTNHFLHTTLQQNSMPDLHLLEIQEILGEHFISQLIDVSYWMAHIAVQIVPFTQDVMEEALKSTKNWLDEQLFAESWFQESARIDKLVNACCSFIEGARVCRFEEAMARVLEEEMEPHRNGWLFHFLWVTLWIKAVPPKHEILWQSVFFIAHAIHSGMALADIPLMQEICRQSIVHSIETMQERRTYLH